MRLYSVEDMPMEIRKLDHAALLVKDVDRSRRFYVQILGMEEVPRPSSFDFPGAWLRKGSAEIHLIGEDVLGRTAQVQPGGYSPNELSIGHVTHYAFEVADLEEARQHLQAHNIALVGGPRPRGDGVMQMYVREAD